MRMNECKSAPHTKQFLYTWSSLCNDCFILFFFRFVPAASVAVLLQPLTAYMWVDTIALTEDDVGTACVSCVVS